MTRPNLIDSHLVELADGRRARVKEYDDGSVRFEIDMTGQGGYAMTECFLAGKAGDRAILKLIPTPKTNDPQ